jgi:D-arabinose 1-dehydrogenase-like Zn-dependent alcohol dehydrogenase
LANLCPPLAEPTGASSCQRIGSRGGLRARLTSRQRAITVSLHGGLTMWRRLADLAAAGVLVPRIERVVRLEEVPEAYRAMATGHGRGKIVVRLA